VGWWKVNVQERKDAMGWVGKSEGRIREGGTGE